MYGGSSLPSIIVRLKQAFNPAAVDHPPSGSPWAARRRLRCCEGPAYLGLSCPSAAWQGHTCLDTPSPPLPAGTMPHLDGLPSSSPARRCPPILTFQPPPTDTRTPWRQGGVGTQWALGLGGLGHATDPLCASVFSSVKR